MPKKKEKKQPCIDFSHQHLQKLLRVIEKKTAEYRKIFEMLNNDWRNEE